MKKITSLLLCLLTEAPNTEKDFAGIGGKIEGEYVIK